MKYVCEICGKTFGSIFGTKIADGYICYDCNEKFQKLIGKHNPEKMHVETYKNILVHPAEAFKYKDKKKNDGSKPYCAVCGNGGIYSKFITSDGRYICDKCASNCNMVSEEFSKDNGAFISSHDSNYFIEELAECYNPAIDIAFNFRTEKIYLQDALLVKNYKIINFSDILKIEVIRKKTLYTGDGDARFLSVNFRYDKAIISYRKDDFKDKHHEFDKVLDCFLRISDKNNAIIVNLSDVQQDIQNENKNSQLKCPKCGVANCTPITETTTSGKNFSVGKGFCGYVLLGPLGILCGVCGQDKQTNSTTYWMCHNCGNKFQR